MRALTKAHGAGRLISELVKPAVKYGFTGLLNLYVPGIRFTIKVTLATRKCCQIPTLLQ